MNHPEALITTAGIQPQSGLYDMLASNNPLVLQLFPDRIRLTDLSYLETASEALQRFKEKRWKHAPDTKEIASADIQEVRLILPKMRDGKPLLQGKFSFATQRKGLLGAVLKLHWEHIFYMSDQQEAFRGIYAALDKACLSGALPQARAAVPTAEQPHASSAPCPFCGEPLSAGDAFCTHCGQRLACPACGHPLTSAARFCGQCGAKLRDDEAGSTT